MYIPLIWLHEVLHRRGTYMHAYRDLQTKAILRNQVHSGTATGLKINEQGVKTIAIVIKQTL